MRFFFCSPVVPLRIRIRISCTTILKSARIYVQFGHRVPVICPIVLLKCNLSVMKNGTMMAHRKCRIKIIFGCLFVCAVLLLSPLSDDNTDDNPPLGGLTISLSCQWSAWPGALAKPVVWYEECFLLWLLCHDSRCVCVSRWLNCKQKKKNPDTVVMLCVRSNRARAPLDSHT